MKKLPITLFVLTLLAAGATLFVPMAKTAYAANCGKDASDKYVITSVEFHCGDTANGGGITSILVWVINFLAAGVGIAVVIGLIFGGITYIASDGDSNKAKQGKDIIVNAIIGLFLFMFLWAAVNFLIPGGLFTGGGSSQSIPPSQVGAPKAT